MPTTTFRTRLENVKTHVYLYMIKKSIADNLKTNNAIRIHVWYFFYHIICFSNFWKVKIRMSFIFTRTETEREYCFLLSAHGDLKLKADTLNTLWSYHTIFWHAQINVSIYITWILGETDCWLWNVVFGLFQDGDNLDFSLSTRIWFGVLKTSWRRLEDVTEYSLSVPMVLVTNAYLKRMADVNTCF